MRALARVLAVSSALLGVGKISFAGPAVTVGIQVPFSRQIPAERIDHSVWNALLQKYVDAAGLVDYREWKATPADLQALDSYLSHLSAATFPKQTRKQVQLAFWINAYNAVTVKGILREYPTTSIRNHTAKLVGYNIWDDLHLLVAGKPYSLNHMEHKILREMGEPRIHFAIVCASIGCPRLLSEAYLPEKLNQQLNANARAFFANQNNFRIDAAHNTIYISAILKWFGKDFGEDVAAQMHRIAPLLPEATQGLAQNGTANVRYLQYDWDLNDQAATAQ
ncbi:MAG: DUF547 domain-containing protein [Pirellulales bacterium]|nr:DUF547 domain-containing protein [Pirellulales bacterium]